MGGCTDAGEASPSLSPTPAVTATPTPSPTPEAPALPGRPAAMANPNADGAAAAATYFMKDLYAYSYATGDTVEWERMTGAECDFCRGIRDKVAEMAGRGETVAQGETVVESAFGVEVDAAHWYSAEMRLTQGETTRFDSSGEIVSTTPGGTVDIDVVMTWTGDWVIDAVEVTPVSAS